MSRVSGVPSDATATPPAGPGRLGQANLSLAIAFTLSVFLSPGAKLLRAFVGVPLMQSLPVYKANILNALVSYWLIAILVYVVLRLARAQSWLNPRPAIHTILGIGNSLLILYLVPRIYASSIEGGGASFAVAMFSPFFVIPAQLLFLAAFVWLAARSKGNHNESAERQRFNVSECVVLAAALAVPLAYASTLYVGKNAPFRLAREARDLMIVKCKDAGERILRHPAERVKGLFLERDGAERYEHIRDSVYYGRAGGILGEPLVNSGLLMFIEKPNERPRTEDGADFKYRRHGPGDWRGQGVNDLKSEYGLFQRDLTSEAERRLGLRGAEITIRDLRTNETLATTTYFVSTRERRFCGEAPNGDFDVGQFVIRALDLLKPYPPAWDITVPGTK